MLFLYCSLIFTLRRKHGYMLGFFLATLRISPFIGIILNNSGIRFFAKLFKTVLPIQIKIMRIRIESFEDSDPDLSKIKDVRPSPRGFGCGRRSMQRMLLLSFSRSIACLQDVELVLGAAGTCADAANAASQFRATSTSCAMTAKTNMLTHNVG